MTTPALLAPTRRRTGAVRRARRYRRTSEPAQASFLELFFDLVLVFALLGVVTRVVPDFLSDDVHQQWMSLPNMIVLALPLLWLWTTTASCCSASPSRTPDTHPADRPRPRPRPRSGDGSREGW